jgi:hypothetical protein
MRLQQWKLVRVAIVSTMLHIDVCNEVIRLIYEVVMQKRLLSVRLSKPILSILSPPQSIFPSSNFFFKYNHEWFDGQNHRFLGPKKLKNSGCLWRHALLSTHISLYEKSNSLYIGSIYYLLR